MTELQLNNNWLYKILYCLCVLYEFSPLKNNKNKLYLFYIYMLKNNNIKILNLISIIKQPCFYRSIKICMYNKKFPVHNIDSI